MRLRPALLALPALLAASPAWAVKEWYDHYLKARDQLIPQKRFEDAKAELRSAISLRREPRLREQTYGLNFVDYLPYYYLGVAHLGADEYGAAMRMFNIEEDKGAIRGSGLYKELQRLRGEAEQAEQQRVARLAREEAQRLLREAGELGKARKYPEALARLAEAQAAAKDLDPGLQRTIRDAAEAVRAEQRSAEESAARAKRIEQQLAEGRRLLDGGQATEAIVRFDQVLALDPRNPAAAEGKEKAQELVLASTTRQARLQALGEGKALFEAGRYEDALRPLTDAAADGRLPEARELLERTQRVLERTRREKELRVRVETLAAAGERLYQEGRFAEAQVTLEELLALDPGNAKAQTYRNRAEQRTGQALFDRWSPNREPALTVIEPQAPEVVVEGGSLTLIGFAADDRGIAAVEFRQGGRAVGRLTPRSDLEAPDASLTMPFQQPFALEAGLNEVAVTVTDTNGATRVRAFKVTRRLRFYETRAFLPSALAAALSLIGTGLVAQRVRRRQAVRRRFNPYIAGAPVLDDEMFFGRQKLMARILNVLHHNSLMITGERRIGKTTFLYHLKKALTRDEGTEYRFFPVLTDLQGVPESAFFHAVLSDVVEALQPSPATLAQLRYRPEAEDYDGRDFSHDLQRLIEELKAKTPKRVRLVLLIDEVDVLNEYSERVNQRLRSIFMKTFSEHLVAVMSGVGIKRTWNSEVSPWYNFFDEVELTPFTREEAEELIRTPVVGVFRYHAEAVEAILAASQLRPYLIQKFCIHAVNHMLEEGRTTVTRRDVESVREAVRVEHEAEREAPPRVAAEPVAR
jgi:tetratricopeptide (TPR) repeat protein